MNEKEKSEKIEIPISDMTEESEIPTADADKKVPSAPESDYLEQLQRLQAEFDNYRKRTAKEQELLYPMAKGDLILKLLPVLDDLERLVGHLTGDTQSGLDGVHLILKNLKKILMDEGLEVIPTVGEEFDPHLHEAVGVEETDEKQDGIVVEEWMKGYRFGGRLLRPSRVKVGIYSGKEGD